MNKFDYLNSITHFSYNGNKILNPRVPYTHSDLVEATTWVISMVQLKVPRRREGVAALWTPNWAVCRMAARTWVGAVRKPRSSCLPLPESPRSIISSFGILGKLLNLFKLLFFFYLQSGDKLIQIM